MSDLDRNQENTIKQIERSISFKSPEEISHALAKIVRRKKAEKFIIYQQAIERFEKKINWNLLILDSKCKTKLPWCTLLHLAVVDTYGYYKQEQNKTMIQLLLNAKCDPSFQDSEGYVPFAYSNSKEICELVAPKEWMNTISPLYLRQQAQIAMNFGRHDVMMKMIQWGADLSFEDSWCKYQYGFCTESLSIRYIQSCYADKYAKKQFNNLLEERYLPILNTWFITDLSRLILDYFIRESAVPL